ncbi:MAG: hypothetical protein COA73_00050 [Candidatus Hydrogenedentota bacterium]|nr:MAG: hypothetical protein COA73_00050 [Candidatus Hydrogenedentota bacterium]
MLFLRGTIRMIMALVFLAAGALVALYEKQFLIDKFDEYYIQFLEQAPPFEYYREAAGGIIAFFGLVIILFQLVGGMARRKGRTITFEGSQGQVSMDLEPVEATLEKVGVRLPEVQQIRIRMKPLKGDGKLLVEADAILKKDPDDDARMIFARVQSFLKIQARKITGLQDVEARLRVKKWRMSVKSFKPEPLMLEAPGDEPEMGVTHLAGENAHGRGDSASSAESEVELTEDSQRNA